MTLFTAEGLIRATVRYACKGICNPSSVIHHALLRWLVTQGESPGPKVDTVGLVGDKRLHHRRVPGSTCLSALRQAEEFGAPAINDSKGCGTIMRVAPLGFADRDRIRESSRSRPRRSPTVTRPDRRRPQRGR